MSNAGILNLGSIGFALWFIALSIIGEQTAWFELHFIKHTLLYALNFISANIFTKKLTYLLMGTCLLWTFLCIFKSFYLKNILTLLFYCIWSCTCIVF